MARKRIKHIQGYWIHNTFLNETCNILGMIIMTWISIKKVSQPSQRSSMLFWDTQMLSASLLDHRRPVTRKHAACGQSVFFFYLIAIHSLHPQRLLQRPAVMGAQFIFEWAEQTLCLTSHFNTHIADFLLYSKIAVRIKIRISSISRLLKQKPMEIHHFCF